MKKRQINKGAVVASGIWKFGENISEENLVELAKEWAAADTDSKYIDLHVRKCSKTCFGIGFKYILKEIDDGKEEEYKKFFYSMTDKLKRRFGNGLVAWDVSSRTTIIV